MTVRKTQRTATAVDELVLAVLDALAGAPELSQRELARRTGLSLTKAHLMLRRLVASGLVQVVSSGQSSHRQHVVHELTDAGRKLHTRLAYQALRTTAERFAAMLGRCRALINRLVDAGHRDVALLGDGPLGEAVREMIERDGRLMLVATHDAQAIVVCDPDAVAAYRGNARLVRIENVAAI